jgi:hypothetical protein
MRAGHRFVRAPVIPSKALKNPWDMWHGFQAVRRGAHTLKAVPPIILILEV